MSRERTRQKNRFHLYPDGAVQFVDTRVQRPLSFAHVADIHLPPVDSNRWPARYRHAIDWWNTDSRDPHSALSHLLDEIRSRSVDFIFFGGDILDYYDADTARHVVEMCRRRDLKAYFQIGNHDWEDANTRYVTHEYDASIRDENARKLAEHWGMPDRFYSFDISGIRFLSLDTVYARDADSWSGFIDDRQARWFAEQTAHSGPIVVFHHVPFNRPTVEYRLRAVWKGMLACIKEDANGLRVRTLMENNTNTLGTFVAHAHLRSEDPLGGTCQFMTSAGCYRHWRYVHIADSDPPKSQFAAGEPTVEPEETP